MPIVTSAAEARRNQRRIDVHGQEYTLSEFVGAMPLRGTYVEGNESNDNGMPQGFLVEQPPGSVTPAHFHETNQFQVFVAGSGRLGARPAPPITVQYANGHTPYGPIVAGESGLAYFTLRQQWDPGAKYVPAALDKLAKGNQRTRIKSGIAVADEAERRARRVTTSDVVLEPEPDGLAAHMFHVAPGETARLAEPAGSGGQYLVVAAGTALVEGRSLERLSTVFVAATEPAPSIAAGADGLDLLVLQFPRLDSR